MPVKSKVVIYSCDPLPPQNSGLLLLEGDEQGGEENAILLEGDMQNAEGSRRLKMNGNTEA